MSHQEDHEKYGTVFEADWDRIIFLIRQGIILTPAGVRTALGGNIQIEDLSPELQALLSPVPFTDRFVGDGATDTFVLSAPPLIDSAQISLNGVLQEPVAEYSLSGTDLIFVDTPGQGDKITAIYNSGQVLTPAPSVLGSFVLSHKNSLETISNNTNIFTYGVNKSSSVLEVAKYRPGDLAQVGPAVDVSSGSPDLSRMVFNGGFLWAIGAASGTNIIQKIDPAGMTATDIAVTTDIAATVTSLATDGVYVYAFIEGGTFSPNSIARIDVAGVSTEIIVTGLITVDTIDMVISLAGELYVMMSANAQVRKYDVVTGNLLKTHQFTDPIRIIRADDKIFVLEGSNSKLQEISATDIVTEIVTFVFTPTNIAYDGNDLWVSSADVIRKVDKTGTIMHIITPVTGLTIQGVARGNGMIWTTYSNDTDVTTNISKIYPGLPGV